jgi:hypothetical protein
MGRRKRGKKNNNDKKWKAPTKWTMFGLVMGVVIATVGSVAALNGWFGGGGSIPEDTFTRGLVGYWSFDEGSGSAAYDASGNGNDGTLYWMSTSSDAWTTGKAGSALSFDGSDDYVESSTNIVFDSITIEAWVKGDLYGDGGSSSNEIVTINNGGTNKSLDAYTTGNGVTTATPRWEWGGNTINASVTIDTNWHYIVGIFDGTSGIKKLYVDGIERASGTGSGSVTATVISIGKDAGNSAMAWDGLIDEVRIYNRALSAEEVRYHYNRGGPVAYWKFDEGSGSTAYDSTENDNNGTLYGEMATSTDPGSGWTTGKYGSALAFDGVDDYVEVPNSLFLQRVTGDSNTVMLWIKPTNSATAELLSKRYTLFQHYEILSSNKIGVELGFSDGYFWYYSTGKVTIGVWNHVAIVFDNDSDKVKFYINGKDAGASITSSGDPRTGTRQIFIGAFDPLSDEYRTFPGFIDDVRIYNYARTPEEIRLDYNAGFAARFGPLTSCDRDPGACMTEGLVGEVGQKFMTEAATEMTVISVLIWLPQPIPGLAASFRFLAARPAAAPSNSTAWMIM